MRGLGVGVSVGCSLGIGSFATGSVEALCKYICARILAVFVYVFEFISSSEYSKLDIYIHMYIRDVFI